MLQLSLYGLGMKKTLITIILLLLTYCTCSLARSLEPIAVDQAFRFTATASNNQTILAQWKIAPGYYLYRARFHFDTVKSKARLGQPLFPASITKQSDDPDIGKYEIYSGNLTIAIPVIQSNGKDTVLRADYQGCSDAGYCYPPESKIVPINLAGDYNVPVKPIAVDIPTQNIYAAPTVSEQGRAAKLLSGKSILAILLGFLGFGILISLTPCVLPMIPILSGIIVGQKKMTTAHAFMLSLSYVLGMAITYAIAGVIVGFIGGSIQALMQQPWVITLFSLVFVAMAVSLFGFYNIQLPERLRNKFANYSQHQKRGTYFGVALMGCFSTLILSPCVTPPLVGVLSYISQTGNATLGGVALFTMGIGMGVPLLIIGTSHGKWLPKTGPWMNAIKNVMGILMLAVAIWMIERIVPGVVSMILWAVLAIGTAVYMGAFRDSPTMLKKLCKLLGIALFIYGILIVVGAATGNTNPLAPINFSALNGKTQSGLNFIRIKTANDVKQQLKAHPGKPAMLDFYADWCISCKEMDHFTFTNPDVRKALSHYVLLRADVTANDVQDKALERHFDVVAPPTIIFFNKQHQEIHNARVIGEMSAVKFLKHLKNIENP